MYRLGKTGPSADVEMSTETTVFFLLKQECINRTLDALLAVDIDQLIVRKAEQIHTPSISLGDIVSKRWNVDRNQILDVPYPFLPSRGLLETPIIDRESQVITFIGRLELRKGILELIPALKRVLGQMPAAMMVFVGASQESHIAGKSMKEYVMEQLSEFKDRLVFKQVQNNQIPEVLAEADVCVFPSIWENFPNVCLEAMSAGRAIVASIHGGMRDMLESPKAGLLVDPENSEALSEAICRFLSDPKLRVQLGTEARKKLLSALLRFGH
ncbi:MAG: glycosyltransferase family 1 protein, partial [Proteobacteria bacterium]